VRRYGLRDEFARVEHLLQGRPGHVGRNIALGNRLFIEAVIWKFRLGAVARSARALRQREEHSHAVLAVGKSGVWESLFKDVG